MYLFNDTNMTIERKLS